MFAFEKIQIFSKRTTLLQSATSFSKEATIVLSFESPFFFFRSPHGTRNKNTFCIIIKVIKIWTLSCADTSAHGRAVACTSSSIPLFLASAPMTTMLTCHQHSCVWITPKPSVAISRVSLLFPPIEDNAKRSTHHCWLPSSACHCHL